MYDDGNGAGRCGTVQCIAALNSSGGSCRDVVNDAEWCVVVRDDAEMYRTVWNGVQWFWIERDGALWFQLCRMVRVVQDGVE